MNFASKLLQMIAFVPSLVATIEAVFNRKSGTEKKDAAMTFLESALSMAEAAANKEIVDEAKFRDGLSQIIAGTVTCLNASVWGKVQPVQPVSQTPVNTP